MRPKTFSFTFCVLLIFVMPLAAQQKAQYFPGQFGLNAGVKRVDSTFGQLLP